MNIPFLKPPFGKEEKNAVLEVMSTSNLTVGPQVPQFEEAFAKYIGTDYAVAVNSGSSALEIALQSLIMSGKLLKGDVIITASYTYVGVANAIRNVGLVPAFAEISPTSLNIAPISIRNMVTRYNAKGIIAVHTAGLPCDMAAITEIVDEFGLVLIEDCAESAGSEYGGKKVGTFGVCSIFSFTPTKPMTTCEGGMIVTNDYRLAEIQSTMRNQGIVLCSKYSKDVIMDGRSARMDNIKAAIGIEQLKKLDSFIDARIKNSVLMTQSLHPISHLITTNYSSNRVCKHVYQLFLIRFASKTGIDREHALDVLAENGVECRVFFDKPIHKMLNYKDIGFRDNLAYTESISKSTFALPMYPDLSMLEIRYITNILKQIVGE